MKLKRCAYYTNLLAAKSDWAQLTQDAREDGYGDLVARFTPPYHGTLAQYEQAAGDLRAAICNLRRSHPNPYVLPTD